MGWLYLQQVGKGVWLLYLKYVGRFEIAVFAAGGVAVLPVGGKGL